MTRNIVQLPFMKLLDLPSLFPDRILFLLFSGISVNIQINKRLLVTGECLCSNSLYSEMTVAIAKNFCVHDVTALLWQCLVSYIETTFSTSLRLL